MVLPRAASADEPVHLGRQLGDAAPAHVLPLDAAVHPLAPVVVAARVPAHRLFYPERLPRIRVQWYGRTPGIFSDPAGMAKPAFSSTGQLHRAEGKCRSCGLREGCSIRYGMARPHPVCLPIEKWFSRRVGESGWRRSESDGTDRSPTRLKEAARVLLREDEMMMPGAM
jgi:hypothetical protein